MHGLWYYLGLTDASGWPYLWWSGIGGRVAIPAAVIAGWWRHHNCHTPGCWRPGHMYAGEIACRHHRSQV